MSRFRVIILGSDDNAYGTARLLHERRNVPHGRQQSRLENRKIQFPYHAHILP